MQSMQPLMNPIHNLNVRRKVTLGNQIKTLALDIKNIFDDHPELLSSQSALIITKLARVIKTVNFNKAVDREVMWKNILGI